MARKRRKKPGEEKQHLNKTLWLQLSQALLLRRRHKRTKSLWFPQPFPTGNGIFQWEPHYQSIYDQFYAQQFLESINVSCDNQDKILKEILLLWIQCLDMNYKAMWFLPLCFHLQLSRCWLRTITILLSAKDWAYYRGNTWINSICHEILFLFCLV